MNEIVIEKNIFSNLYFYKKYGVKFLMLGEVIKQPSNIKKSIIAMTIVAKHFFTKKSL